MPGGGLRRLTRPGVSCCLSRVSNIDFKFIKGEKGAQYLDGYVRGATDGESGVVIATRFALGTRDEKGLAWLKLPPDLVKKLQPYLGKQADEALSFLKANPLKITKNEADLIDEAWMSRFADAFIDTYNKAVKAKGGTVEYRDLIPEAQTAVASVAFQYTDLAKHAPRFWGLVLDQDFYGTVHELRTFNDPYPDRRNQEGDLLQVGLDRLRQTADAQSPGPPPATTKAWLDAAMGKDGTRCFPLAKGFPKQGWEKGGVSFGANRCARAHAACDLVAPVGTIIYAVADGTVIQGPYGFYLDTYALEINHGAFTVRYGEIAANSARVKPGQKVTKGQPIAKVGKLKGSTSSMLHFEMYRGEGEGPLTVLDPKKSLKRSNDGVSFQRRGDLVDCTPFLNAWQKNRPA
jgi:murein DD-endopeptidase MepM/ murein hydrolase activator NlpD